MVVSGAFDPYLQWLGIRDPVRPPNHYRLLGVELFESDPAVISTAADRQMAHVRTFQTGRHADLSQQVLNELSAARVCLLRPEKKSAYDAQLRARMAATGPASAVAPSVAPPGAEGEKFPDFASLSAAPRSRPAVRRRSKVPWVLAGLGGGLVLMGALAWPWLQELLSGPDDNPAVARPQPAPGRPADSTPVVPPAEPSEEGSDPPPETDPSEPVGEAPPAEPPVQVPPEPETTPEPPSVEVDWAAAMLEVRRALSRRQPAQAAAVLGALPRDGTAAELSEAARLRSLAEHVERFWEAVAAGQGQLQSGDTLTVSGKTWNVDILQGETLVARAPDGQKTWTLSRDELDPALAAALAEIGLAADPSARAACLGAFWALDGQGDRSRARALWAHEGLDSKLRDQWLAELEVPLPGAAQPPELVPEPAPPLVLGPQPPRPDPRVAVPEEVELRRAQRAVDEVFAASRTAATTPEKKQALAKTLLARAAEVVGRPAEKMALLAAAREAALAGGDPLLVVEVLDLQGREFAVDLWRDKGAALGKLIKQPVASPAYQQLSTVLLESARQAAAEEHYDVAAELARGAVSIATRQRNRESIKQATALEKEIREQQRALQAAQRGLEQLQAGTADADAALAVGRYLCLTRGDWEPGLPYLVQGSDERLRELARLELSGSAQPPQQAALGDAWFAAAAPREVPRAKYLARARHWYALAVDRLEGLEKSRVEQRLAAIGSADAEVGSGRGLRLEIAPGVRLQLQWIPAGTFLMGAGPGDPRDQLNKSPDRLDESPHPVTISRPFYLGATEVTQEQWAAVMREPAPSKHPGAHMPVGNVDFAQCQQFCVALQRSPLGTKYRFRLPTEAEWEYACRAGTRTPYFWGHDPRLAGAYAWGPEPDPGGSPVHPVGALKPNPWGLFDMAGNAAEWCADFYGPYEKSRQIDPLGPSTGPRRVNRGESPRDKPAALVFRSAHRASNPDKATSPWIGLRLAVDPL